MCRGTSEEPVRLRLDCWGCGRFRASRNLVTRGGWHGEGSRELGECLLEGGSLKGTESLTEEKVLRGDFAVGRNFNGMMCGLTPVTWDQVESGEV